MTDLFLLQSTTEGSTSQVSSYYQVCYSIKKIEKFYLLKGLASGNLIVIIDYYSCINDKNYQT